MGMHAAQGQASAVVTAPFPRRASHLSTSPQPAANVPPVEKDTPQAATSPAWFQPTRWSVVLASAQTQAPGAQSAMSELCKTYWQPLYSFARRRGHDHHRAQDMIQGFFLSLIESKSLSRVDPHKGKFRSYLLASLQNHMASEHTRDNAQKRGGGMKIVSLDDEDSDARYNAASFAANLPAETAFEREWAIAALEAAISKLEDDFEKRGKAAVFRALKPYLLGDQPVGAYDKTAAELGLSPGAIRTGVHRLRHDFRMHLRREVAKTVDSPDQIDEEMRHLRTTLGSEK
ncbi:RNA polymerase subunit sigma-24 [Nibricoccus aquaticus]|uniref:RNA polymerase subunit sigma-24 n=1 Tax=Nibricoccus aquaticus TaxID=2576891 RepID=A0A290QK89_9BACT|nr:RNA polymerase subunit sigma-24 [Nibricoccus aquaticus]